MARRRHKLEQPFNIGKLPQALTPIAFELPPDERARRETAFADFPTRPEALRGSWLRPVTGEEETVWAIRTTASHAKQCPVHQRKVPANFPHVLFVHHPEQGEENPYDHHHFHPKCFAQIMLNNLVVVEPIPLAQARLETDAIIHNSSKVQLNGWR